MSAAGRGVVYLVGAGPGDPGLITVRGRDLLRCSDVVVYDRLVSPELLCESAPGAELIDVGKSPGCHKVAQETINDILIARARCGKRVVRLKGGDPFVFGRGAEEMDACRAAGVVVVVVPGVSSAIAGPGAADIPMTQRNLARSFAVFTARTESGEMLPDVADEVLTGIDTLIFMMGRACLPAIARRLIDAGRDADTPAACVENATTAGQRITAATLETIADAADRDGLSAPVVIVVGLVAARANTDEMLPLLPISHRQEETASDPPGPASRDRGRSDRSSPEHRRQR